MGHLKKGLFVCAAVLLGAQACSSPETSDGGAPTTDSGTRADASVEDAGLPSNDAGVQDSGEPDAGILLPGAPTNVTADAGIRSAFVEWSAPANLGRPPLSAYVVTAWLGTDAGGEMVVPAPATSAWMMGLENGADYAFTVAAQNAAGSSPASPPSPTIQTPSLPAPPQIFATSPVTAGMGGWQAWVGARPGLAYQWAVDTGTLTNGGGASGDPDAGTNVITYVAGPPGYLIIACTAQNAVGQSPPAVVTVESLPLPDAPVVMAQSPVILGSSGIGHVTGSVGFFYSCGEATGLGYVSSGSYGVMPDGGADFVFNPFFGGGSTLDLRCIQQNAAGTFGPPGDAYSFIVGTPVVPSATATGGIQSASVTWATAQANGSPVTQYTVTPYIAGVAQAPLTLSPAVTMATLSGLQVDAMYSFGVSATNDAGTGAAAMTPSVWVTGPPASMTLTATPTNVPADGVATTTLSLTLVDSAGHPVPGQPVQLSSTGTQNIFAPDAGVTNAQGAFSAALASPVVESKVVTASSGTITATTSVAFTPLTCPGTLLLPGPPEVGPVAAVADLNQDGFPDLVLSPVSVRLGHGDGTFGAVIPAPSLPFYFSGGVAPGDFNGDGKIDLLLGADVAVLFGNGDGTFRLPDAGSFNANAGPGAQVITDFNNDGWLDFLSLGNSRFYVFLGNGDGTFRAPLETSLGSFEPNGVAAGDFNRDGIADVAVTEGGSTVLVFTGAGDGTFVQTSSFQAGMFASAIVSGDFQGDGGTDLAVLCPNPCNALYLVPGNGDGTFGSAVPYMTGFAPIALATGDFNADGILDVAVADQGHQNLQTLAGDGDLETFLGNGDGTLRLSSSFGGGAATGMAVADLDRDGRTDVLLANASAATDVLLARLNGTFQLPATYSADTSPRFITSGDSRNSGVLDLLVVTADAGTLDVFLGHGDGGFDPAVSYTVGGSPSSIALGDLNADGHVDVAVASPGTELVSILFGRGDGTFQFAADYSVRPSPSFVLAVDVNGDGVLDLVVSNPPNNAVSVLLGQGGGVFGAPRAFGVGPSPQEILSGDFNKDGKVDLAVASGGVAVLLGNGDGTFQPYAGYQGSDFATAIVTGDFDGDGNLDLATAGSDGIAILQGYGDGTFHFGLFEFTNEVNPSGLVAGDFNGDGRLDLAVSNLGSNSIAIFIGTDTMVFRAPVTYTAGVNPSAIAIGDFNRDGTLDFATANGGGLGVSVLLYSGCSPYHP